MNTKRTIISLLICLLLVQVGRAQEPAASTTFTLHCYEVDSEQNITIHFGYTSAGGERFVGSGFDFVTEAGEHPDAFTVQPNPYDPQPALGLAHTVASIHPGIVDTTMVYVPLTVAGLPMCGQTETPSPVPTPHMTPCAHSVKDSGAGEFYCYEPLAGGIVPLPSKATNP